MAKRGKARAQTKVSTALVLRRQLPKHSDPARPEDFDSPNWNNALVHNLVRIAQATATVLDQPRGAEIPLELVIGLGQALRVAADRVNLYVLEETPELSAIAEPAHALYVLRKEVARLEQQELAQRIGKEVTRAVERKV